MTESKTVVLSNAAKFGKDVGKDLAYQASVSIVATAILLGAGLAANKIQQRRAKKAALKEI